MAVGTIQTLILYCMLLLVALHIPSQGAAQSIRGVTRLVPDDEENQMQSPHASTPEDIAKALSFDVSFQDLNIPDEREAQSFCNRIMDLLGVIPDTITCTCRIDLAQLRVVFSCSTEVCLPDVGIIDVTDTCIVPSYEGILRLNGLLSSKICNDAMTLPVQVFGLPVDVPLPEVCATAEHQRGDFSKLTKCGFTVGTQSCPCTVCESGQEVTIDCRQVQTLGPLRAFAKFDCIGLDFIGVGSDAGGNPEPFVNPFVQLVTELGDQNNGN